MLRDYIKVEALTPTVTHADWVYTRSFTAHGTFEQQVRRVLTQLRDAAAAADLVPSRYARCEIVLKDLSRFETVLQLFRELLDAELPTIRLVPERVMHGDAVFSAAVCGPNERVGALQRYETAEVSYPLAIRAGRTVYTSSFWASDPSGLTHDSESALEQLFTAVRAVGARPDDLVKNFVVLTDMDAFEEFNAIYGARVHGMATRPARTSHGVSALPDGASVAIDGIAIIDAEREAVEVPGSDTGLDLPFSAALRADDLLFVSGQVGVFAPDGSYRLNVGPQTTTMFELVETIAAAAGSSVDHYVKATGVVTNPTAWDVFLAEYMHRMPQQPGVLSVYEVSRLSFPAILTEMDVVAVLAAANPTRTTGKA
ncbi:RidA family protein [Microbacterium sp. SORGH_AS_0862]|uniref:RidA family protein n=1 Tax=Microbacterium sp. SORGH_AS_0862 TaxID=3041789 RepID=UPI0027926D4D|nr:RidA family protein [Microbacterium sp. SORGH_AS_0862]MDQ1206302.1 enamine deaminase RidA (YjgF/YER057c/UK114 family) [Microbacterium sp. SORGH_AS_0862]